MSNKGTYRGLQSKFRGKDEVYFYDKMSPILKPYEFDFYAPSTSAYSAFTGTYEYVKNLNFYLAGNPPVYPLYYLCENKSLYIKSDDDTILFNYLLRDDAPNNPYFRISILLTGGTSQFVCGDNTNTSPFLTNYGSFALWEKIGDTFYPKEGLFLEGTDQEYQITYNLS